MSEIKPLKHLVLIPDGDRRWAKNNNLPAWEGHRRGAENIKNILEVCRENKINYLTMWAFSTENWARDEQEVSKLMELLLEQLHAKKQEFLENEIRFRHIGRKDRLSKKITEGISKLEEDTKHFKEWNFQVCLDYGGRDEILRAAQSFAEDVKNGKVASSEISEEIFKQYLDTKDIPDPDLIIRTSGEQRLSGLLPFQGVYAELMFPRTLFPDFTKEELNELIKQYYDRDRRFGGS